MDKVIARESIELSKLQGGAIFRVALYDDIPQESWEKRKRIEKSFFLSNTRATFFL